MIPQPPTPGLRARMTQAVGWNTVGTVFNQGSTFLVNIILAHLLATRAFGHYAMIQTTLAIVASMAQLASGYTAAKYVAEYRDRAPHRAGQILGLCAVVSFAMAAVGTTALLFGSRWLAAEALKEPELSAGLMIASGVVFFAVMNGFLLGALAGFESFPQIGKAGIASGTLYVVFGAAGGQFGAVNGALIGIALSAVLQFIILWTLVLRETRRRGIAISVPRLGEEREILFRFYLPAALNGLVTLPAIWLANAAVARQSQGYEQLALFTAANSFRIIVLFLPNILNTVGMSVLNNQRGAGDEVRFRRLFWSNLAVTAAIASAGAIAISIAGPMLLKMFGITFTQAYPILLVLMIAAVAEGVAMAIFQSIQSHGFIWSALFGVVLPSYGALVLTAGLLARDHGAMGLAWAYVVCWSIALASNALLVRRLGVWSAPHRLAASGS